ncbi:MAG: ribonuclease Z [Candidatus Schekmanbacteria bacterium]|nr:ribonuclease Z [Candidatus Schekmanbacteria bacterium]
MKITFLGTSSATPTLRRGLPAVALQRDGEVLLFDCGEGTQMQLQKVEVRPSRIAMLLVTHLHGDHVTGIMGLLMSLKLAGRTEPLIIHGPAGIKDYVLGSMRYLRLRVDFALSVEEVVPGDVLHRAGYDISVFPLDHTVPTLGYALEENMRPGRFNVERARALGVPEGPMWGRLQRGDCVLLPDGRTVAPAEVLGQPRRGRKIVYALDTAPCRDAISAAAGASVLIHDATFAPEEEALARQRKHSTSVEAAAIAQEAAVEQLYLTHISARYTHAAPLMRGVRRLLPTARIAHDLMDVEIPLRE